MSEPENGTKVTDRETSARARRDELTGSVGRTLPQQVAKAPWWKRLFGRS